MHISDSRIKYLGHILRHLNSVAAPLYLIPSFPFPTNYFLSLSVGRPRATTDPTPTPIPTPTTTAAAATTTTNYYYITTTNYYLLLLATTNYYSYSYPYSDSSTPLLLYSFLPSFTSTTLVVPVANDIAYSITVVYSYSSQDAHGTDRLVLIWYAFHWLFKHALATQAALDLRRCLRLFFSQAST
jgi:hypothetical protein